jgi:hypothetical protein
VASYASLRGMRRASIKSALTIVCALLLHVPDASAIDSDGRFAMKGAGLLPCGVYVTEREKRSNAYYLIGGWVEGYVSAYNKHTADTFDVASFESLELLLKLMQQHCAKHPNDRLHGVLDAMIVQLAPARLVKESERVRITVGDRSTRLYAETIRRMQAELARRGLFKEATDGRFTEATQSALIAFQADAALNKTGFPDQTTLWRLLRK